MAKRACGSADSDAAEVKRQVIEKQVQLSVTDPDAFDSEDPCDHTSARPPVHQIMLDNANPSENHPLDMGSRRPGVPHEAHLQTIIPQSRPWTT